MYLGQSGFLISKDGSSLLIDPYGEKSGDVEGDLVYCTHAHSDHTSGVPAFMERNPKAILVANHEVIQKFQKFKDRVVVAREGEIYNHGNWALEFIKGEHGLLGCLNMMVAVRNGEDSFGHCGDTITLKGFYNAGLNVLAVPIIGLLTTSPSKAIEELKKFTKPLPVVVPMHWLVRSPNSFCESLSENLPSARCIVPDKGKILQI